MAGFLQDVGNFFKNPLDDLALAGVALTGGLLAPELLPALGIGAAATDIGAAAGAGAADLSTLGGATAAGIGAGVDPTAAAAGGLGLGTTADVAGTSALAYDTPGGTAGLFPQIPGGTGFGTYGSAAPYDTGAALPNVGTAYGTSPVAATAPTANLSAAATAGGDVLPTTDTGVLPGYEGAIPSSANPQVGGQFGLGSTGATPPTGGFTSNFANAFNTSTLGATAGKALANPLTDIGIAGLGYNLYQGYQNQQAQKAITNQITTTAAQQAATSAADVTAAQPLISSGTELTKYLQTGTLPPAFQAQVQQQVQAAKAQIIQGYATRGQSTDPNHNSALAQDLANVDNQALTLQANLESTLSTAGTNMISTANQLLASGASAASISGQLPIQVSQLNLNLNNATSAAISNFAAALNGGKVATNANAGTASPFGANLTQATSNAPAQIQLTG